jgi:alkanesulfonate monooxygenase SsuD/methylene tetrahydromethanopterin reductase-like flavin-dependent oxidoreductase (luciferase family)
MLDEGLAVLTGLWSGQPFSFAGEHYNVTDAHYVPTPVQPKIPIWVAGMWPTKRPFRRAAQWDGAFPLQRSLKLTEQMTPDQLAEVLAFVNEQRPAERRAEPFELVHAGLTAGTDPGADRALVESYAEAGVTWWLENFSNDRGTPAEQRARILKGPPRIG